MQLEVACKHTEEKKFIPGNGYEWEYNKLSLLYTLQNLECWLKYSVVDLSHWCGTLPNDRGLNPVPLEAIVVDLAAKKEEFFYCNGQ